MRQPVDDDVVLRRQRSDPRPPESLARKRVRPLVALDNLTREHRGGGAGGLGALIVLKQPNRNKRLCGEPWGVLGAPLEGVEVLEDLDVMCKCGYLRIGEPWYRNAIGAARCTSVNAPAGSSQP